MRVFTRMMLFGMMLPALNSFAERTVSPPSEISICTSTDASSQEKLAAKEVQRYLYLRTGKLAALAESASVIPGSSQAVIVARKDRPMLPEIRNADLSAAISDLGPEQYLLRTVKKDMRKIVVIVGGDDAGVLYGAYRFAEKLGVRFYLHGDVVPDERIPATLPDDWNESGKPLFATRGIQPFHDFPEGPDWWSLDDYKAILSQLPKLRMNFFGLHTYPEGGPNAEPGVWIGSPEDAGPEGAVRFAYPASWQNTLRGNWGYLPKKTGEYTRGASLLFDRDDYGVDVMNGCSPQPSTPEGSVEVFGRAGALLRGAFTHARALGVKTCIGTETPLVIPKLVQERLRAQGKDPADSAVVSSLYEGVFRRIAATYPLDYYWFWTPEGWTWSGTSPEQVRATITDLRAAQAALEKIGSPFKLATCGWVLGPENNRSLFGEELPKNWPLSCINRMVGMTPVDPAFTLAAGHSAWAIPWMEDDPALTQPQLWVGRMRSDAVDALRYGCDGLLGIHWRTRVLGPNVSALAHAAWEQEPWKREQASGPVDGKAFVTDRPVEGTAEGILYGTMRTDVSEYRFVVPNGSYSVKLRFCEPTAEKAGERVFDIALQGRKALERLDIFARVGKLKPLDVTLPDVSVGNGLMQINFLQIKGAPCVSAIEIEGKDFSRRINCGGSEYKNFDADWTTIPARYLPTVDFYDDWCGSEFGPAAGPGASIIFQRVDGYLPRPADWVEGPGGIRPDTRPWESVMKEYAFVDEFAALRPQVKGKGSLERYDYWLNTFQYLRAMGRLECAWGEFTTALGQAKAETDPGLRAGKAKRDALPLFLALPKYVDDVYSFMLRTVGNTGELGTVMNWEQHLFPLLIDKPREELGQIMGSAVALPPVRSEYTGPARLIVPTSRGSVSKGEALTLAVIVLSDKPPVRVEALLRPMGKGAFTRIPLAHVARGVYRAALPKAADAFEYSIYAVTVEGTELVWPATAPEMCRTVVVE